MEITESKSLTYRRAKENPPAVTSRPRGDAKKLILRTTLTTREAFVKPDLAEFVSQYVDLKKTGKYLRGLCPFHTERTPSFFVDPIKNRYRCYGCGASGDAIQFCRDYLQMSFKDAVKYLGMERRPSPHATRRKQLVKDFHEWCNRRYSELADLFRELQQAKDEVRTVEDAESLADFYHMEPSWIYELEILDGDNEQNKYELYREITNGKF